MTALGPGSTLDLSWDLNFPIKAMGMSVLPAPGMVSRSPLHGGRLAQHVTPRVALHPLSECQSSGPSSVFNQLPANVHPQGSGLWLKTWISAILWGKLGLSSWLLSLAWFGPRYGRGCSHMGNEPAYRWAISLPFK